MNLKLLSACALVSAGYVNPALSHEKPNIILILIDDMGYPAISCYGNRMVKTPNIDKIAENGIRFSQGYVTPQSTPSRASLLTGQYTARNKMWHVIPRYGYPYARIKEPDYLDNLPREQFTMAEALKSAGYTTACLGKWHLSTYDNDGYYTYLYPDKAHYYGFDYVNLRQDPPEYQSYGDKGVDFLTNEAIRFMEKNKGQPFFIYLSHHTIHNPVLAPKELVNKYTQLGFPEQGLNFAEYLAAIEHLDNSVGRLLNKITELGIENNTIVFFISDNGGVDTEFENDPLRYGKGTIYEGGIRVPFIVQWKGKIKPGQESSIPVHIIDIYPTILDIAGISKPKGQILDGVSILPVLLGKEKKEKCIVSRALYFYQPLYDLLWGATPSAAILQGRYKLIWFFGDYIDREQNGKYIPEERVELYDLKNDIGEKRNLVSVYPEIASAMKENLKKWIVTSGALIPELNPDYNPLKWNQRVDPVKED